MKYLSSFSRRTLLLAGLIAAFFTSNPTSLQAGEGVIAPGDLTVTVEEQGDGSVKFTLSGTAYMQDETPGWMRETNFNPYDESPPFAGDAQIDLPEGLTLTVPDYGFGDSASESGAPQEIPAPPRVLEVYEFYGSGFWGLGHDRSGELFRGDAMTGAGSITTREVPFNLFTPGTFVIEAGSGGGMRSESESSVEESPVSSGGIYPYSITYKVIAAKPSLAVSGPGAFPKTVLGKRSRLQQVTITNNGTAPLTNLDFTIAGSGAREFSSSALARMNLPAGASTSLDVRFRPTRKGNRRATLTATGVYTPPTYPIPETTHPTSVEEGAPEPIITPSAPTPVVLSASTTLTGKGLSGKTLRPLSPRFPRGRR